MTLRSLLRPHFYNLVAPRPRGARLVGRPVVAGLFRASSGIGEGARLSFGMLAGLGLQPRRWDMSERFAQMSFPAPPEDESTPPGPGPLLLHLNPPEALIALAALGHAFCHGRYMIGAWAWEAQRVPPAWSRAIGHFDEIWLPSRFCAEAVQPHTVKPVRIVPPVAMTAPATAGLQRRDFGLGEARLVVLAMADMFSSLERKNLMGAIKAHQLAFEHNKAALLYLKVSNGHAYPEGLAALRRAATAAGNVIVSNRILDPGAVNDLIRCADIVLSLHRAEGYGRLMAGAMQLGKAVVATGWSGNCDFMTPEVSRLVPYRLVPVCDPQGIYRPEYGLWADPDLEAAAGMLRELAEPASRELLGQRASRHMNAFSAAERYRELLGETFLGYCRGS